MTKRILITAAGILSLIGGWYLLVSFFNYRESNFVYQEITPVKVIPKFIALIQEDDFWQQVGASFYRVGYGLFLSLIFGVPLGILYSRHANVKSLLYVPFQFLRMISPLSWMPLAILLFDGWDKSIIFLIVMAAIWPIIFNLNQGIDKINPGWIHVGQSLQANLWQQLRHTILPAIMQDLFTGLRLSLGIAWVVIVPAEYLGVTSGLGYSINDARDTLDYSRLMALIISIGVMGYGVDLLLKYLNSRFAWK